MSSGRVRFTKWNIVPEVYVIFSDIPPIPSRYSVVGYRILRHVTTYANGNSLWECVTYFQDGSHQHSTVDQAHLFYLLDMGYATLHDECFFVAEHAENAESVTA